MDHIGGAVRDLTDWARIGAAFGPVGSWIIVVALVAGPVVLYVWGGWLEYWSLHAWRVGIKAAVRKQREKQG